MTHIPTGIKVKQAKKNQHQNKREAIKLLTQKVNHYYKTGLIQEIDEERKEQIGDGDKRRTYRIKDGLVLDHITNKSVKLKDVLKGKIELFN